MSTSSHNVLKALLKAEVVLVQHIESAGNDGSKSVKETTIIAGTLIIIGLRLAPFLQVLE